MVTLFPLRFSLAPLLNHGEAMPENLKLDDLEWDRLLFQIKNHPDPKVRQDAVREATQRVWDGPGQPEERIPARMFLPEE